jgi:hypothetical protein
VQTLYSWDNAGAVIGVTFIAHEYGRMCHRRVRELSKDCNFAREMLRVGLATHCRREKSLAARLSLALRKELGSCVGLEAMRPEAKAVHAMGYSAYATPGTKTCSNQRDSILQSPFSSASVWLTRSATYGRERPARRRATPWNAVSGSER